MSCLLCFCSDGKLQKIEGDLGKDILKNINIVLPKLLIPETVDPLFICPICLEQVSFFHTIKKASLQNCCRLKHFNAMLKGTDNFKCNEIRVILNSDEGSAQSKHQIKFKVDPKSKFLLSSEDQDAIQIKEEDKTYGFHYQQFDNDGSSSNHLQDDSSSSCIDDSTEKHENSSQQLVNDESSSDYSQDESSSSSDDNTIKHRNSQVNKFTKKDINITLNNSCHKDQPKTQRECQKKSFECADCHKTFTYRSLLEIHSRVHTGQKPYKCTTCQKAFAQRSTLNSHTLTHTGEKPHECDVCHKTFTHKSYLITHKRYHNNVRPFQCAVCSKAFTQSSHLTRHKLTHSGEKPHQCHLCQYKCTSAGNLKVHMRSHTGEKPYSCKHCDKSFTSTSDLKRHERSFHSYEDSG